MLGFKLVSHQEFSSNRIQNQSGIGDLETGPFKQSM